MPLPIEESIHLRNVAETVTLAKLKLGEIINSLPKQTNNNPNGNNQHGGQNETTVDSTTKESKTKPKPKAETIAELGISQTRRAD